MIHDEGYWTNRYLKNQTQWDAGGITTPLKEYIDQLNNKQLKILIPGCGNAYEAAYLYENGFASVFLIDLSNLPLNAFTEEYPAFPKDQLIHGDFFDLEKSFDLIIEQTFFCALHPTERPDYARKMNELLTSTGKLVGVFFEDELFTDHPPYGGYRAEYKRHFQMYFEFNVFDTCYNSIKPRQGRELSYKPFEETLI
ncbi:MAG: methyltransferase domain-containing protein [Bacteroidota bacterium]